MNKKRIQRYILDKARTDRERQALEGLILKGQSLTKTAKDNGASRQRLHAVYSSFIGRSLSTPSEKVSESSFDAMSKYINETFPEDLYLNKYPELRAFDVLCRMKGEKAVSPFIKDGDLYIRSSKLNKINELLSLSRSFFKKVSVTDLDKVLLGSSDLNVNKIVFAECAINGLEDHSVISSKGKDYLLAERKHDTHRILKMLAASKSGEISKDSLFAGYMRYISTADEDSDSHMTQVEHDLLVDNFSIPEGMGITRKGDKLVVRGSSEINEFLSETEEAIAMSFGKKRDNELLTAAEINQYVTSAGLSSASARKAMDRSCILVPISHGTYKLIS